MYPIVYIVSYLWITGAIKNYGEFEEARGWVILNNGGVTQGCPYPISQIFYPPISHIPDFFNPNIPYPRFFNPQYPISQISQSIDHIPDFARLECACIHSFDIQLVRMDPILLDIFIIAVNILVHGHLELHFKQCTPFKICTWRVIKMHSIIQTLNFTKHRWKITEMKICCMLLVFTLHLTK